jgi:hypothetical protein
VKHPFIGPSSRRNHHNPGPNAWPSTPCKPFARGCSLGREVARSRLCACRRNADALNNNALAAGGCNPNINGLRSKACAVLEVVVSLACRSLPRLATVGRDLERLDSDVGVDDLHAEPVRAGAGLVLQDNWAGNTAGHEVPADGNHALAGVGQLLECVGVQVKMVGAAAGALVGDHGFDAVAGWPGDGYTGAAVAGVSPVGVREGGAEEARREGVASIKGALSTGGVAAIEGGLATLRASSRCGLSLNGLGLYGRRSGSRSLVGRRCLGGGRGLRCGDSCFAGLAGRSIALSGNICGRSRCLSDSRVCVVKAD